MWISLKYLGRGLLVLALIAVGAEGTSRLDDWIQEGTPFFANPNRDHDLLAGETWGLHGKPHGRFRKWHLNAYGFRGPEIEKSPVRPRVMILGASETFGLYESAGHEYPAQLAALLPDREVVNAALAGITLKSMIPYWDHWAGEFQAQTVIIYPSPLFYLDNEPPALPKNPTAKNGPAPWRPRVQERVRDVYRTLPQWVKKWREDWVLRGETEGRDATWFFRTPPEDRLALFGDDLQTLVEHIRRRGATPILCTHARRATAPPEPEDEPFLRSMGMFFPRASGDIMVGFEVRANDVIRALAAKEKLGLIDVDRKMTGQRQWFADLVHFNDPGAKAMADVLAQHLSAGR